MTETSLRVAGRPRVLDDDGRLGEATSAHDEVAVDRLAAPADERQAHGRLGSASAGMSSSSAPSPAAPATTAARSCGGRTPRAWACSAVIVDVVTPSGSVVVQSRLPEAPSASRPVSLLDGREAPVLLATGRERERRDVEGRRALGPRLVGHEGRGGVGVGGGAGQGRRGGGGGVGHRGLALLGLGGVGGRVSQKAHQPTAPSICRLDEAVEARGRTPWAGSRAIGSMKPRTIIAMASSSAMPRDMR